MNILKSPQFGQGIFYGFPPGMNFFLNLLLSVTRKKIHLVETKEQAEAEYQNWLAKERSA